jgi:hypothetical protein
MHTTFYQIPRGRCGRDRTDVWQTGVSGEQSQCFATVNVDEFNRILT